MTTDDTATARDVLDDPYEVIPQLVFDHACQVGEALIVACLQPDAVLAAQVCVKLTRDHGIDGVFTTALFLAEIFVKRTGVGPLADELAPGQSAYVRIVMPDRPPLFDPPGQYPARRERAQAFVQAYVTGHETHMYADLQTADDDPSLLHGLCELVAATFTHPASPEPS